MVTQLHINKTIVEQPNSHALILNTSYKDIRLIFAPPSIIRMTFQVKRNWSMTCFWPLLLIYYFINYFININFSSIIYYF